MARLSRSKPRAGRKTSLASRLDIAGLMVGVAVYILTLLLILLQVRSRLRSSKVGMCIRGWMARW